MKLKEKLLGISNRYLKVFKRFPISFSASLVFTCICIYSIITIDNINDEVAYAIASCGLVMIWGLLLELASEYGFSKFNKVVNCIISIVIAVANFFVLNNFTNDYITLAETGIFAAGICLVMALLYKYNNEKEMFPWIIHSFFYSTIATTVVFVGLLICLLAFNFLIYSIDELYKLVLILADLCEVFALYNLFISFIPEKGQEMPISNMHRSIIHKLLFYVYILLVGILYLYIAKIIITWKMPVGVLNWFGSLTLLFYVFFQLNLLGEDNSLQGWFKKFGGLAIIPILLVQLFAIYIRLNSYGLTSVRYLSLVLILIAMLFIINSQLKKNYAFVFAVTAVIMGIITISPLNIFNVPNWNQEGILKKALLESGVLADGELNIKKVEDLSEEQKDKIVGAYDYLRYSQGNKSEFVNMVLDSELRRTIYKKDSPATSSYLYYHEDISKAYDIHDYKTVEHVYSQDVTNIAGFDCSDLVNLWIKKNTEGKTMTSPVELILPEAKILFVNLDISYTIGDLNIKKAYIEAYVFRK